MSQKGPEDQKRPPSIIRYSGLGLQIALIIGGFSWLGKWLDTKYEIERNWFTLGFVLFGVTLAIWYAIRTLNKINK